MFARAEIDGDENRFATSSVMDYGIWTRSTVGPGRYDYAYVLHRYVDMVEAFEQLESLDDSLNLFHVFDGGYRRAITASFSGSPANTSPAVRHYTDLARALPLSERKDSLRGHFNSCRLGMSSRFHSSWKMDW